MNQPIKGGRLVRLPLWLPGQGQRAPPDQVRQAEKPRRLMAAASMVDTWRLSIRVLDASCRRLIARTR
ncbi:hypothetical protein [Komagataeibacter saccharivorans]|uniref:hypothetical protein n=1 Tax=Komagataeibacter saccharivorans TaxID=265959 RepID=UPI0011AF8360|nr:hypothetical protein [Komagataeibacter saccharivorans]